MKTTRPARRVLCGVVLAALPITTTIAAENVESEAPSLSIAAISISPERPAADTLCRLAVSVANTGDQVASQLGFRVEINDAAIPVYANQLFMYPLEPGAVTEIDLFNFWSTETSRPFPANGKLKVEVSLTEAQWTSIEDIDGVETWTPHGSVAELPVSRSITLEMSR